MTFDRIKLLFNIKHHIRSYRFNRFDKKVRSTYHNGDTIICVETGVEYKVTGIMTMLGVDNKLKAIQGSVFDNEPQGYIYKDGKYAKIVKHGI